MPPPAVGGTVSELNSWVPGVALHNYLTPLIVSPTQIKVSSSANKGFIQGEGIYENQEDIARKMRELESLQAQLKKIRSARTPRH